MTRRRSRWGVLVGALLAMVLLSGVLATCGGGVVDRSAEIMQMWANYPGSADWDLAIRDVVAEKLWTGEHDKPGTVYLTTWTSKKVPEFAGYGTIASYNSDEDTLFAGRVEAYFATNTEEAFLGIDDPENFMRWYVTNMKGKYFISVRAELGPVPEGSLRRYELTYSDTIPTSSTMKPGYGTKVWLTFDPATGAWAVQ